MSRGMGKKKAHRERTAREGHSSRSPQARRNWLLRTESANWLTLALTLATTLIGLFGGAAVSAWYTELHRGWTLAEERPCLEGFGHVSAVWTYEYPFPNGTFEDRLRADLPNGSQFYYFQTIRNSGGGPLYDVSVKLNLPGVPYVTRTDRTESRIDVPLARVLFLEREHRDAAPMLAERTIDPRVLHPENLTATPLRMVGQDVNGTIDIWGNADDPFSRPRDVIAANGANTVSYTLPVLPAGSEWRLDTLYFGKRADNFSGGELVAAAESMGGLVYHPALKLTALGPGDSTDTPVRDCAWEV